MGLRTGGNWCDVLPKPDGSVVVVVGDAAGRGDETAAIMAELRAAARAVATLDDDSPSRLVGCLDRMVTATGLGHGSALVALHVQPRSGRVEACTAGRCPPLLSTPAGSASFLGPGRSPMLGDGGQRRELEFVLGPESTLFLFSVGLARAGRRFLSEGLDWIRTAAARGPHPLDAVFDSCLGHRGRRRRRRRRRRQGDDVATVVALRLNPDLV